MKREEILKLIPEGAVDALTNFVEKLSRQKIDPDETTMSGYTRWARVQNLISIISTVPLIEIIKILSDPKCGISFLDEENECLEPVSPIFYHPEGPNDKTTARVFQRQPSEGPFGPEGPFSALNGSVFLGPPPAPEKPSDDDNADSDADEGATPPPEPPKPTTPPEDFQAIQKPKRPFLVSRPDENKILQVVDGYVAIDWVENIPVDKYMISRKGQVINRYTGKITPPININGVLNVRLIGVIRPGRVAPTQVSLAVKVLVAHAFPPTLDDVQKLKEETPKDGKVKIEQVTKPAEITKPETSPAQTDANETATQNTPTHLEPERLVWIDWINGIPKNKYQVSSWGYIRKWGEIVDPLKSATGKPQVYLSAAMDERGHSTGCGPSYSTGQYVASLVIKAFFKSTRHLKCLRAIKHKDGNVWNCALDNLEYPFV